MTEEQAREIMLNYCAEVEDGKTTYYDIVRCTRSTPTHCVFLCVRRGMPIPENNIGYVGFWVDEDGTVEGVPL